MKKGKFETDIADVLEKTLLTEKNVYKQLVGQSSTEKKASKSLMIVDRGNTHYTEIKNIAWNLSNLNGKKEPRIPLLNILFESARVKHSQCCNGYAKVVKTTK